ncbi:MAG: bifunctional hydroxymethylpyrimidine kinase/phosphomethylpyrimidine kinase [Sedimentisphaerales bacterium]|nr:bifunctional hydroxymethylpyrimidine kinase/phosphomethylpyrimidine kinase [Sedimentisphaerales bacterium]
MSLLVTGSIGIDTVKTPFGVSENCLGGSAVYFSYAASFFAPVRFVGVVGPDCPFKLAEVFKGRNVDLAGLEVREKSKTFRWSGTYLDDMDNRTTDYLELNVLAEAPPKVPAAFSDSKYVFLANTAPKLQLELLEQIKQPQFVAADTMNCWIESNLSHLKLLLKRIDCLIINEDEARLLACEKNLIKAGKNILDMGPKAVLIKKGHAGSLLCSTNGEQFILPAFPVENVIDPTGAGDSFAGGFMGYLVQKHKTDVKSLKEAIAYGTVTASFTIEGFSLNGLSTINRADIDARFEALRKMTSF